MDDFGVMPITSSAQHVLWERTGNVLKIVSAKDPSPDGETWSNSSLPGQPPVRIPRDILWGECRFSIE